MELTPQTGQTPERPLAGCPAIRMLRPFSVIVDGKSSPKTQGLWAVYSICMRPVRGLGSGDTNHVAWWGCY